MREVKSNLKFRYRIMWYTGEAFDIKSTIVVGHYLYETLDQETWNNIVSFALQIPVPFRKKL